MIETNFEIKASIVGDKVVADSKVIKEMNKEDFLKHYIVQMNELSNLKASISAFKQKLESDQKKIQFPEKIKKLIDENRNEIMAFMEMEAIKEEIRRFEKMEYNTQKELTTLKPIYMELKKELDKIEKFK